MTNKIVIIAFLLNYLCGELSATTKTVSIYNTDTKSLVTSSTLRWESYDGTDHSILEYAVVGAHTHAEEVSFNLWLIANNIFFI